MGIAEIPAEELPPDCFPSSVITVGTELSVAAVSTVATPASTAGKALVVIDSPLDAGSLCTEPSPCLLEANFPFLADVPLARAFPLRPFSILELFPLTLTEKAIFASLPASEVV